MVAILQNKHVKYQDTLIEQSPGPHPILQVGDFLIIDTLRVNCAAIH